MEWVTTFISKTRHRDPKLLDVLPQIAEALQEGSAITIQEKIFAANYQRERV
jgi:hypothetical protein